MPYVPDLYACLGISPKATPDQVRGAYRASARRFHPDSNRDPQAADEFKLISQAYELLSNARQRDEYDFRSSAYKPVFLTSVQSSRTSLLRLPDPQAFYMLVEIRPSPDAEILEQPLNLALVIDRSTSMQGARLDQVKSAARQIIDSLNPRDFFSVVAFSDRAEVILPAQHCDNKPSLISRLSTINASGGTEILHGLLYGLLELQRNHAPGVLSHLILLTDGRTYGDEDNCLLLARLAELDGVILTGLGIGDEWNDAFIDNLAAMTGGQSQFISAPAVVTHLLTEHVHGLSDSLGRVTLQVICDPGVTLKSIFRVAPEAQPIALDGGPAAVGKLAADGSIQLLLEMTVATTPDPDRAIARLRVNGDILTRSQAGRDTVIDVRLPQTSQPDISAPPLAIVNALDRLTLYRLQEKAWADAEDGNIARATQRLQTVASRLLENGERDLAAMTMNEASRLNATHQISAENRKRIKYGTRALIPPPSQDSK